MSDTVVVEQSPGSVVVAGRTTIQGVTIEKQAFVSVERESVSVVTVEPRGRGLGGVAEDAATIKVTRQTGEIINGHRVVAVGNDSLLYKADPTDLADSNSVLGVVTSSYAAGVAAAVIRTGLVAEGSWTWVMGSPIFLGADGLLTQTAPSAPSSAFSLVVGFPVTPTSMYVDIQEPIVLA